MHECRECGRGVADTFRFCPWCAFPQRTKLVEFFAPHPGIAGDARKAMRVSRYLGGDDTPPQFRFSIWEDDAAAAAVSLTEQEAARLADFVAPLPARRPLLDQLRDSLHL